jgi:hypothetical protein
MPTIVRRGTRPPAHPWIGRYQCASCRSVIDVTEADAEAVMDWGDDQRDGRWITIVCPVCERERTLGDCRHVVGQCREG